ncbi:hypothetical protein IscW_ISCW001189 [Ixodes scapularis]|uniref:Uncharacterized protein n=1 Tax=Ixodes scapularis TaxID=6945 RepID=B7P4V8_IXOSC|nr:hypothetical protein IscW_ISCW001189 [Ixodes scapularis]|eukprot:XP_002406513.1 hypothetical protein IscW_ISCW001189 [Ixodes scapularis]
MSNLPNHKCCHTKTKGLKLHVSDSASDSNESQQRRFLTVTCSVARFFGFLENVASIACSRHFQAVCLVVRERSGSPSLVSSLAKSLTRSLYLKPFQKFVKLVSPPDCQKRRRNIANISRPGTSEFGSTRSPPEQQCHR